MSLLTKLPDALSHVLSWRTNILVSRNGTEQRISTRDIPRDVFSATYLADSEEAVQYWKGTLLSEIDYQPQFPLWHEAVRLTAPTAIGDNVFYADFSLMDDALGSEMLLLHPDETTHEVVPILSRTNTSATLSFGGISNTYPIGAVVAPISRVFLENNSGYSPMVNVAASVALNLTNKFNVPLVGKGAISAPTHQPNVTIQPGSLARSVLVRRPFFEGQSEVFSQRLQKIDFGGAVRLLSQQVYANIVSGRSYRIRDAQERQFWKRFLGELNGSQKAFYTSTYRSDMTISPTGQPTQGGTSFRVLDDAPMLRWAGTRSHSELSVETADGTFQYVTIDPTQVVNNNDGTYTVGFLPALTNTPDGSNVVRISFLELVRLDGDVVTIEYGPESHKVTLAVRAIEE